MNKTAIRRAIKVLNRHARERFDACKSASGEGFVCGTCEQGNVGCEREHAEIVTSVKELRALLREADRAGP